MKQVQIPEDLFLDLITYFSVDEPTAELYTRCRDGIDRKIDAIVRRNLYSDMHNQALTPEDRERARQEYLDGKGIPDSFRWSASAPETDISR